MVRVVNGYTQLKKDDHHSSVGFCVLILKNRTGNVVKDIEVLFNSQVNVVSAPKGTKADILSDHHESRIKISAIQARAELRIEVNRLGGQYVIAQKVFVGDEDMGQSKPSKSVRSDAIVFPNWFGLIVFPILLGIFSFLTLDFFFPS